MNRTTFRKYLYLGIILGISAMLIGLTFKGIISYVALLGIVLGLFVLSRIINYPLRHFYKGLNAFKQRRYDAAEQLFNAFLQDIERRPWIKKLIWWSFGVYTYDLEAMTWNNLGAIQIEKGQMANALQFLNKSIELDPSYPKPVYNLAVSAAAQGQVEQAEQYFQKARELGFTNNSFDQFLTTIQSSYAAANSSLPK